MNMWSWLSGKNKSNLPDATPLQIQRSKQIEQLKIFHNNVTEIQRDVEYRVTTAVGGKTVSLYITLPPRFPQDKPQVKVSPAVQHAWVNELMYVTGSPSINHFSVHSDLGAAIKEIVDEFQRNPPVLAPSPSHGMERYTPYPGAAASGIPNPAPAYSPYPAAYQNGAPAFPGQQTRMPTLPPSTGSTQYSAYPGPSIQGHVPARPANRADNAPGGQPASTAPGTGPVASSMSPQYPQPYLYTPVAAGQPSQPSVVMYQMPEMPTSFVHLQGLSKEELEGLLEDEEKLLQTIQNLPQLTQLQRDRTAMCERNEQLSRENLSKKPVIEDKKRIILEKYDQLNELRGKFDELSRQQDSLRQRYSVNVLQDRLRIASAQAEEEAEALAENFIDGALTLEDFRKKYMEVRTLSHLRKAKEEKLNSGLVRLPLS